MQHVGGYGDLLLLEEDAVAYEDVLTILAGEADAAKIRAMQSGK